MLKFIAWTGAQRHSDDNVEIIIITADEASSSCHVSHAGEQKYKNHMMSHTPRLGGSSKPTVAVRAECTACGTDEPLPIGNTIKERNTPQVTQISVSRGH